MTSAAPCPAAATTSAIRVAKASGPAVWLDHNLQWVNTFLTSGRSWSHIYGVSEGQWRLLPGTARPLCRQVNCRTSLLLHQEAPIRVVNLDTEVLNWNLQSILQDFWPGWGKPQCTSFLLPQYYWIEELLLLVRRFISFPITPNFILKAQNFKWSILK